MEYKQFNDGYIQRVSDGAIIPCTEENADYLAYLSDVGKSVTIIDSPIMNPDMSLIPKANMRSLILDQISALEDGIYYSELDGDMKDETTSWADFKKAQRLALKQQLANLGA
jgi:hypothetical protein